MSRLGAVVRPKFRIRQIRENPEPPWRLGTRISHVGPVFVPALEVFPMNKLVFGFAFLALFAVACGGDQKSAESADGTTTAETTDTAAAPAEPASTDAAPAETTDAPPPADTAAPAPEDTAAPAN